MLTTYRLKAKELSIEFLESLKTMFTGQEVEITVKSVEHDPEGLHRIKRGCLQ